MLNDAQLAKLSPLGRTFRDRLLADLPGVAIREWLSDRYELEISAAHPAVGALHVWDHGEELTFGLGEYHHWHIRLDSTDAESWSERLELAAGAAVEQMRELLADRTVLRLRREGGRVAGSTSYSIEHTEMPPPGPEDVEYVWSGPRRVRG